MVNEMEQMPLVGGRRGNAGSGSGTQDAASCNRDTAALDLLIVQHLTLKKSFYWTSWLNVKNKY